MCLILGGRVIQRLDLYTMIYGNYIPRIFFWSFFGAEARTPVMIEHVHLRAHSSSLSRLHTYFVNFYIYFRVTVFDLFNTRGVNLNI